MNHFIKDPALIESRSMEIIAPFLDGRGLDEGAVKVFSRIIHAAGDPDYANHIRIHPLAIQAGIQAIRNGKDVFCDVEMVRTGINKKVLSNYGSSVQCRIATPETAERAKQEGITRSMAAMRSFGVDLHGSIVAIGNAPTALFEVLRMIREDSLRPALIIGIPVGFVGAAESKDLLVAEATVPFITVAGNKGGSPIAAATFNAILYMLEQGGR